MTLLGLFPSSTLAWRDCWEAICISLKMPKTSWNWRSTRLRYFPMSPQASSQPGFSQIKMATHLCEAFVSRECGQWAVNCSDAWKVFPKRPHVKHLLNHELPLNNNGKLLQARGGLCWSWYLAHTRGWEEERGNWRLTHRDCIFHGSCFYGDAVFLGQKESLKLFTSLMLKRYSSTPFSSNHIGISGLLRI